MPRTKDGEVITWKEFGKRWKKGIAGITPEQKINGQIYGTSISFMGLLFGFGLSIWHLKTLWWLSLVLLGGMINTGIQLVGLYQQKKVFDNIKELMKGGMT